ncbi:ribonuclease H1 domain-containing protein [Saccharicrinis fermentans]|uniref:Ribonuclease H n=1 Tax=Saccharicrinis fermentans DSM 9555 = JCM 21142 TaxID=869213 RepID=W7XUJ5_9BACT|nr:ribonuclease H family protein [Saccharicrinis fermentans]GAF01685.1 ribonuclease H [Saccharicrinis fermentans DSM 9555 = JCM 21142]
MAKKNKFYVVWNGHSPGIYTNWTECQKNISGVSNVRYKGFPTLVEAEQAYAETPDKYWGNKAQKESSFESIDQNPDIINNSLSVDAACSGNPGVMEYQGVYTVSGTQVFIQKFPLGTNNIGEFLAIVHGLAYQQKHQLNIPIYTDSKIALSWIKAKKCRSKLPLTQQTQDLFKVIKRAEDWLKNNKYSQPILKWDTQKWGEIPADFGRK